MVIDDFPQWFEYLFIALALVVILGVWNAGSHLAGIGRQLAALGQFLDDSNIKDITNDVDKLHEALDDIRIEVEKIADPEAVKRRRSQLAERTLEQYRRANEEPS